MDPLVVRQGVRGRDIPTGLCLAPSCGSRLHLRLKWTIRRMSITDHFGASQSQTSSMSAPLAQGRAMDQDALAGVRLWLWSIAALVFAMVVVGGATRLTESGLSITEWKVISGVIPPLTDAAWLAEFEKYKQIPQYAQLFPTMDLSQFKSIFFWEWGHRLLGRIIGFAFAVPLVWFAIRGRLRGKLAWQCAGVLALGGLQGFVGWWMVSSGLTQRVEVAPERLATHLLLASITFATVITIAVGLKPQRVVPAEPGLRRVGVALVALVLLQIGLGALVAGGRAGLIYNTWPLMDGHFVPPLAHLTNLTPVWLNVLENVTLVQFNHRMLAYTVMLVAGLHALQVWRSDRSLKAIGSTPAALKRSLALAGLVSCQAVIGIITLLLAVPLWAGLLHQAFAMIVLAMATVHARLMFGRA